MKTRGSIFIENLAEKIIDNRVIIILIFLIAMVFSLFSMGWVNVEDDIINYLDEDGKTRQGIVIMEEEFTSLGMAEVMVSNISYSHGQEIVKELENINGVSTIMFEDTEDYYKNGSALFVVMLDSEEQSERSLDAMKEIRDLVEDYDSSISTEIGVDLAGQLGKDMLIIGILASIVVLIVLLFSSKSYGEIPVLIITFGAAALLNMGSNFLLGRVSFISHSVAVVLQLALAIDYAIILAHRYTEERERLEAREAAIAALSKAIPEISSSSLTTVGGLAAMGFMKFGIGLDLSIVLIKAILLSMLSVFVLMPGLLLVFSGLIDKSQHRSFVPSVEAIGRYSIRTRYIIPPIFIILLIAGFIFSSKTPYRFSMEEIRPSRLSQVQKEKDRIEENFGKSNMMALMVPSGDFDSEKKLLSSLSKYEEFDIVMGLSNTEAMEGYMLTDKLKARQFSELVDIDYEMAQLLYSSYALKNEDFGRILGGIGNYGVALIDMFEFLHEQLSQGYLTIDEELKMELEDNYDLLANARLQMEGEHYSRILIYANLAVEGEETFDLTNKIYKEAGKYYDKSDIYLLGESPNAEELSLTFVKDNLIISILSVVFVIIVLIITFRSFGLALLLISVIQASIWINFSFPYIRNQGLYFLGFLIVSSIQMGANIDYAIVITSRYLAMKKEMKAKDAIIKALDQAFPTVITSGSILAIAGYLIGFLSTDGATSILGRYIGQGTIISVSLVIFVLPQLLYLGDLIIEKTSFAFDIDVADNKDNDKIELKGRLRGYIKGEIDAVVDGSIRGKIKVMKSDFKEDEEDMIREGEGDSSEKSDI